MMPCNYQSNIPDCACTGAIKATVTAAHTHRMTPVVDSDQAIMCPHQLYSLVDCRMTNNNELVSRSTAQQIY